MYIAERKDRRDLSFGRKDWDLHAKDSHSFRKRLMHAKIVSILDAPVSPLVSEQHHTPNFAFFAY